MVIKMNLIEKKEFLNEKPYLLTTLFKDLIKFYYLVMRPIIFVLINHDNHYDLNTECGTVIIYAPSLRENVPEDMEKLKMGLRLKWDMKIRMERKNLIWFENISYSVIVPSKRELLMMKREYGIRTYLEVITWKISTGDFFEEIQRYVGKLK